MTTHTSGPWEWVGRDLEQKGGEYKTVIGTEVSCGQFCYGGSVDMKISDADARLIAAAPEMLEALKLAMEIGDGCSRGFLGEVQTKIQAAITKATGT
jgi:hypothetical protein